MALVERALGGGSSAIPAPEVGAPPRRFFTLIDQLRGVAAVLIVYAHLVGNFLDSVGRQWTPSALIDRFFGQPLQGEVHLGWLAVAVFFFMSGFVITHVAQGESTPEFVVKRFLRIYPPVVFAALVAAVIAWCGVLVSGLSAAPGATDVILSATLVNFLVPGSLVLIGVGWTLLIEVMFYILLGVLRPLLSRRPAVVPLALLAVCLGAELAMPVLGSAVAVAVVYLAFVPVLTMGQIIYLTVVRRVPVWAGALLMAGAWLVYVFGMQRANPGLALPTSAYFANVALAGAVFVIAVLAEGRVKPLAVLAVISRRSLSLYLLHVPVGFTILTALVVGAHWAYTAALAVALVSTAAATELSYRFVEVPSLRLGRWISQRIRHRESIAPVEGAV